MNIYDRQIKNVFLHFQDEKKLVELASNDRIKELYDKSHKIFKIAQVTLFFNNIDLAPHMQKTLSVFFKNRSTFTVIVKQGQKGKGYNEYQNNKYSIMYNDFYSTEKDNIKSLIKKNYLDYDDSPIKKIAKNHSVNDKNSFLMDTEKFLLNLKLNNGSLSLKTHHNYNETDTNIKLSKEIKNESNKEYDGGLKRQKTILNNNYEVNLKKDKIFLVKKSSIEKKDIKKNNENIIDNSKEKLYKKNSLIYNKSLVLNALKAVEFKEIQEKAQLLFEKRVIDDNKILDKKNKLMLNSPNPKSSNRKENSIKKSNRKKTEETYKLMEDNEDLVKGDFKRKDKPDKIKKTRIMDTSDPTNFINLDRKFNKVK